MTIKTAAVVGAGMAGLTVALALAQRGVTVHVIEQAPYLAEVGAGLQISPNASRILAKLGVLPALEAVWTEPERISMHSGKTLAALAAVPVGKFARERWHSPYGVLHRSTLQNALATAVEASPLCQLHLGHRLESLQCGLIPSLVGIEPDLIIGADGVWSMVRSCIEDSPEPDFSGNVAWRFTVPFTDCPSFLNPETVSAFLGPSAHLVAYPLAEAGVFNLVAIAAGINPGHAWSFSANSEQKKVLLQQFRDWNPAVLNLLRQVEDAKFWPLYQVGDGAWHDGQSKVLIGDAAHAMMPFSAQGAAMAIEDAWLLAQLVTSSTNLPDALRRFEMLRKARAKQVRKRGDFNRFVYHARGPIRVARDLVLSMRSPQSLAADLDWLYGYEAH